MTVGLLSSGMDGKVHVSDMETFSQRTLHGHTRGVHCIAYSPKFRLILTGGTICYSCFIDTDMPQLRLRGIVFCNCQGWIFSSFYGTHF
jgi:WD40 repeat protein